MFETISDNGVSRVYLKDGYIYKEQPKFLTDNEIYCLDQLHPYNFVPRAKLIHIELIRLEYIKPAAYRPEWYESIQEQYRVILKVLKKVGIRHGDLTEKNILLSETGRIYVIDFSESRLACDPRPDKRREGDKYWMEYTVSSWISQLVT